MQNQPDTILISGTSYPELAKEIGDYIGVALGKVKIDTFPDGEILMQVLENVRGKTVFVIQSIAHRPNHYLMELLIMIDALKRASAGTIVAVLPYFAYSRQDRKDKGRVPITARLVADLLETAGAHKILTMDLHADQIQGFFDVPVDNIFARPELISAVDKLGLKNGVVVSPDLGSIKLAKAVADHLKVDLTIIDKRRLNTHEVEHSPIIGDVKNKEVLLVDDMCSTGGTLVAAANTCKTAGALKIYAMITHGLFAGMALEKIKASAIEKLLVSNTIAPQNTYEDYGIHTVSVAGLFGEAIKRIASAKSISSLFE